MVSILLLYFILAAQFESFLQPLIVIFTLPLGVGGAFLVLWLTGTSLNVMSAIGLVVMLGIMVNDAILKIDTINRLRVNYRANGIVGKEALTKALYRAGEIGSRSAKAACLFSYWRSYHRYIYGTVFCAIGLLFLIRGKWIGEIR